MLHTLAVLVENHPGVLTRVSGLFARRAYNIESLSVCRTEDPDISRMTIVVDGDDQVLEQVTKQLHKLVVVHKVVDLTSEAVVNRELALVRVKVNADSRLEVLQTVDVFRGQVVDMGRSSVIVELTGDGEKIDAFVRTVRPYGLMELVRTGKIAILRSES
ncbi:acetolactate synthase [Acididesulfobacillus acetoxydans]|uniref:Acetolactate synthase small subunit n=1 Tax=Acididesulfobacillus acetoxydans TaxID=1561005 RepID=A0A8S0Y360_9FIRM|nr:acetolactate synthase small subunit [Acididesulfobacillus acetoxydans]CAA7601665.1 acetolactate synthase [Acididesulfobacillus acetoxydans]CEJ09116.1 Acetolactate synthase, small subunit [Acididesulfobacillus acetoxydans]